MSSSAQARLEPLLEAFAQADCCWFASTRADGRAHLAPIWHVWYQGTVYVVTTRTAVRTHNIQVHPHVSLALPDPMNVFVLEGIARLAPEAEVAIAPLFQAKYGWDIVADTTYDTIIAVQPLKAMAWGAHGEGRWRWVDGRVERLR